jgi:hypothetical protein
MCHESSARGSQLGDRGLCYRGNGSVAVFAAVTVIGSFPINEIKLLSYVIPFCESCSET